MAARQVSPLRIEVLGSLRLTVSGTPVDVPGTKRRAVLGLLALAEGRMVTVDSLVDALWPSEVPDSGRQALHSHVSRLRGHLGPAAARLETGADGYRLAVDGEDLDLAQARSLLAAARTRAPADPAAAMELLRQAHGLWRGPVLADLVHVAPIAAAVEECGQLHREVTDALVATAIAAGQAADVLGLAAAAQAEDPLREPAVLLLMRALAAAGQAPDALRAGREYRRRLTDEVGLDPSPALDELEREIAGGALGAAPVRSGSPARPATALIGRETQVAALHRVLTSERLVTVVGPGGVGKTRVALEVARASGPATVLLLGPVTDPAAVPHALAAALDLRVVQGDVLAACLAVLGDRPCLLVVDNCEHLLDPVRDTVADVLAACPRVSVLATSRERLGLAAEHTFRLAPLPVPRPGQDPLRAASVTLFLDRARRVRPGPPIAPAELPTVAEIVHRLDGMPLAIELAAGRLSSFSPGDLRDRLDRSLDLLGGGSGPSGDARHRTLRATVAWSYDLLAEDEQRLFRQLSVFTDGVDLDTAERLAADLGVDGDPGRLLAHLVDASMLDADLSAGTRYRMLETLRAFGMDRLAAAGEEADAVDRLIRWAVDLAGWIDATIDTDREPAADRVLRRELANLRTAWRLARERGRLDATTAIIGGLFDAIAYRDMVELRGWAEELAGEPELLSHPRAAVVLGTAGEAAYHRGDRAVAERLVRTGLDLVTDDRGAWVCLMVLSVVDLARGAHADATAHALAASRLTARPRENLGVAALAMAYAGDLDGARALNERGLDRARSPSMRSWATYVRGEIDSLAGRSESAESAYVRAIELARASGGTFLEGVATVGLLAERARSGRTREALSGYREVIDYFARTGDWTHLWATLRNLADLLRGLGDGETAAQLDAAADAAPDAPADDRRPRVPLPGPAPGRGAVLQLAREAVARNLTRS
ncbi:BTAD domain-containing putative transcriptional regulator [Modestobacter marinus]|uniref:BTAD domain-containing putative transcriptional regulator n=1 Tax=Modestobacter marinus TaxID=477641 RepID=UPI0021BBE2D2|nr:BTAD domain-containing putative transcriptional regulator [Modestobacter marinus]